MGGRIVRNKLELNRIREYIRNNPVSDGKWIIRRGLLGTDAIHRQNMLQGL